MKFKSRHLTRYLIMFRSLFLVVVFIDQNRAPALCANISETPTPC